MDKRTLLLSPVPSGTSAAFMLRWLCETTRLEASAFGRFDFMAGQVSVEVAPEAAGKVAERVAGALLGGARIQCHSQGSGKAAADARRWAHLSDCLAWEAEDETRRGLEGTFRPGDRLGRLRMVEETAGLWGRTIVTLAPERGGDLPWSRLDPGLPVVLVTEGRTEGEAPARGVVTSRLAGRLVVALDDDPPGDGDLVSVSRAPDEVSMDRLRAALARVASAGADRVGRLRDVASGEAPAEFVEPAEPEWINRGLNESQKAAVRLALGSRDIALVHGPPGTGKTTTLLEVVRQAVRRGERVLVAAPSNLGVDNLLSGLAHGHLRVVRLGHPARVHEDLLDHSLDALVERHPDTREARRLAKQARALFRKAGKWTRAKPEAGARQADRAEARRMLSDARALDEQVVASILRDAQVVAATATGLDAGLLGGRCFDLVVLDEAAQATEPAAWSALIHADRAVLAGDPCQLPPTVVSDRAARAGLGVSLLERLLAAGSAIPSVMLDTQYRMNSELAAFPSADSYGGKLLTFPGNASIRLAGSAWADPPFLFVDTAGTGWEEQAVEAEGSSRWNLGEADYVVHLARALLGEGVPEQSIGLITPYAAQARLLRERLGRQGVEIDSVDGFQGREKDVIVVSMVRSNETGGIGFLAETRRTHVAITRARRLLVVVGDSVTLGSNPWYQRLVERAREIGGHRSVYEDPIGLELV
ncbi:MAG: AAA domain-containing protein [Planctomycetota bacterium]